MSFILKKKKKSEKNIDFLYEEQYNIWKNNQKDFDSKFFLIYKDFEVHLKDISQGALKLYLYYGFHAKNDTGLSWHGIETISNYFNVSERSINNWNKELEERGLIARTNRNARSKNTYLLPFSLNVMKLNDLSVIKTNKFNEVYGNVVRAFHLFQFRKQTPDNESFNQPYNLILLVCSKKFPKGKYKHFTVFEYNPDSNIYTLNEDEDLKDTIYLFDTDITLPNVDIDFEGIVIHTKHNLKLKPVLINVIKELLDPDTDFSTYKKFKSIKKEA